MMKIRLSIHLKSMRKEGSIISPKTTLTGDDFPEFQSCLQPKEYLDWVAVAEEILEFKEVPDDRRVSLVVMTFRGQAAT